MSIAVTGGGASPVANQRTTLRMNRLLPSAPGALNPIGLSLRPFSCADQAPASASMTTRPLPTCSAAKLQNTSTEAAEKACGSAIIGSGEATTLLPLGTLYTEPTKVTAFNGTPQGGKPVVLLHAYGTSPVQTTLVLVGVVSDYGKEGYGPRLDVTIPPIAGGSGAITDFKVKIQKTWTYKGQKMSFINAKCPASKKLKYRGAFSYKDGTTITATHTQPCTPKAEPKKK